MITLIKKYWVGPQQNDLVFFIDSDSDSDVWPLKSSIISKNIEIEKSVINQRKINVY